MDTLTESADYITVHVPLNENTKNIFDLDRLKLMKSSARIINVARGGIINEKDLALAVKEDVIAGAAIDVFTAEPIDRSHPLVGVQNILLSPHLGASTTEAKEGVSRAICEQVRDFLLHEKLNNALNMPVSNLSKIKEIQPILDCAELLGQIESQLVRGPIKKVSLECQGTADEIRILSLALLKGLLEPHVPDRINYINAETIAKELGVEVDIHYSNTESNYLNLISVRVTADDIAYRLDLSLIHI